MRKRTSDGCTVEACDSPYFSNGYCKMHHARWSRTGDPGPAGRIKRANGEGNVRADGYRAVMRDGKRQVEHRIIMAEALGRDLLPHENVHHINGDRLDNRLDNLELWSTSQPKGQRLEDKVSWACDFLSQYGYSVTRDIGECQTGNA